MCKIFGLILSHFGYAKVPIEAVQLCMWIKGELLKDEPDSGKIYKAAAGLEMLLRSAIRVTHHG